MHKPALAFVITFGEGGGITEPRKRFFHGVLFLMTLMMMEGLYQWPNLFSVFGLHRQTRQTLVEMEGGQKTQRHSRSYEQKIRILSSLQCMRNRAFVFFFSLHIFSCAMVSSTYL